MTTLTPSPAYTEDQINQLYPANLELQLVQVLLRHGERTPVVARFQNVGLAAHWPYCSAAERFRSAVLIPGASEETTWTSLQWRRRLEGFGVGDRPTKAIGPAGQIAGICQLGELTDRGRQTTYDLGTRLRRLYINQLHFMPDTLESSDQMYLRCTPIPRALESLQQAFTGMYPPPKLSPDFVPPTIVSRTPADETLYPNDGSCRRFGQLSRAFGQRTAQLWNSSPELDYVNSKIGKYMPEASPKVAVDSHPRLSGILDTVNSTLAHGPETRLPKAFYEEKLVKSIDKIVTEEWFAGYKENKEYRTLGIGSLAGDIVERMSNAVDDTRAKREDERLKFAISGCHDTTLAALLVSFGGFQGESWPKYSSHIAVELFKRKDGTSSPTSTSTAQQLTTTKPGWFTSTFGSLFGSPASTPNIGRKPFNEIPPDQKSRLKDYYVRVRYNDSPVALTACRKQGNHLEGDESLCTFEAFKRVVDEITPRDWKEECMPNKTKPIVGVDVEGLEPAGLYKGL